MAYWLMVCRHKPDVEDLREKTREAHRAHVASGGGGVARVLIGSALTEDDAATALGNFGVLEADSREAAIRFAETDPYALAGIVADVTITALPARFPAGRIDPMSV
ncbi:YciI family protein [Terrarubrum flagellatum]|uniref:YciI family protein n=1 Tax=Terrirubrum flagellatum TaxID=2895980 RepID=UPI003144E717